MSYEGGYTSAVNSASTRDAQGAQTAAVRQRMQEEAQAFAQAQADREDEKKLGMGAIKAFALMQLQPPPDAPQAPAGPQAPPPGQGSPPMAPPAPPSVGGMPPVGGNLQALMARSMAPPGGAPMGAPPMPQGAGPGQPPMAAPAPQAPPQPAPPPGWQPSPSAPAALSGGAPAGRPAPSPGGMPTSLQPPPAAAGPQPGAAPPSGQPAKPGTLPPQWLSVPKAIEAMDKAGIPPEKQYATLSKMMPMIDKQNKQALDDLGFQVKVSKAMNDTLQREIQLYRVQKEGTTPFQKEAETLYGKGTPEYKAAIKKHLDKMDAPSATTVNLAAGGGENDLAKDPETRRFMAEQYWAGDPSVMQNLGRGAQGAKNIVALRHEIVAVGKEMGKSPKDLAAAQAEFQGMKAGERTLGTRTANIEMAAQEAKSLAGLALDASEKLPRSGLKSLNDVIQAAQSRTASPELRAFVASNTSLINAYARAINPQGVGTVADKEHAREMLSTAFAKGDYRAAVTQLLKEIDAAQKSPRQVKESMREGFTSGGGAEGGKTVNWSDLK